MGTKHTKKPIPLKLVRKGTKRSRAHASSNTCEMIVGSSDRPLNPHAAKKG
jgi:hypothetical protein